MIVDHCVAELVDEPAHADRDGEFFGAHRVGGRDLLPDFLPLFLADRHQFHPNDGKKTAKKASRTMTRKIAATTAAGVRRPTSAAFWRTGRPNNPPVTPQRLTTQGARHSIPTEKAIGMNPYHRLNR